jgi:hypothetical protein
MAIRCGRRRTAGPNSAHGSDWGIYYQAGLAPPIAAAAATAPRFGTNHFVGSFRQRPPALGSLSLSEGLPEATIEDLEGRGHRVALRKGAYAAPCLLQIDPRSGEISAAGDPKAGRHAAAY